MGMIPRCYDGRRRVIFEMNASVYVVTWAQFILTQQPPGFAIYLKQPMGKIYPLLECADFQGENDKKQSLMVRGGFTTE